MESRLTDIRDAQKKSWDEYSAGWKKWDAFVMGWIAPVGEELIRRARLREDAVVLDVAAGTGEPGLTVAERTPKGKVTITDLSERMLTVAEEKAASRGIKNVETRQCDVTDMPFGDATFDAVLCRFGVMFFPDIGLALNEMVRVSKNGARICASVWGSPADNLWATTIMSAIAAHVELPTPSPGAPGVFRCAEPGLMSDAFASAGLKNVEETDVSGTIELESPDHYWKLMNEIAPPVVAGLAQADEATHETIKREATEAASATGNGRPRFGWLARVISGEK